MKEEKSISERLLDWHCSRDTGSSSEAIANHMTGRKSSGDFPFDSGDFGRCYRLLKLIPEWRPRMPEMAARFPAWKNLVSIWGELETLYDGGSDAGHKAVYERMKPAVKASAKQDGWMDFGTNCRIKVGL